MSKFEVIWFYTGVFYFHEEDRSWESWVMDDKGEYGDFFEEVMITEDQDDSLATRSTVMEVGG